MKEYLDSLEDRMKGAPTCDALFAAAQEAIESLEQGLDDAKEKMLKLQALMTPPTSLPGVIIWIKAMIETYAVPYKNYLEQIQEYARRLEAIQKLLAEKASELSCGSMTPKV